MKSIFLACLFLAAGILEHCAKPPGHKGLSPRSGLWSASMDSLEATLSRLESDVRAGIPDTAVHASFLEARLKYKGMEFLWEYAFPASARKLNGSAADEAERKEPYAIVPGEGFQSLEEGLFPEVDGVPDEMAGAARAMRGVIRMVRKAQCFESAKNYREKRPLAWSDSSVLDAIRLELHRLASFGLTGFDSPLARNSLPETRAALLGMEEYLNASLHQDSGTPAANSLLALLRALQASARAAQGDFVGFDRLRFLVDYLDPVYAALADYQIAAGVPLPREARAFSPRARSLFSAEAWNPGFFRPAFVGMAPAAAPAGPEESTARIALGRRLFSDPVLGGGSRTCASCHRPDMGFTDGSRRSPSLEEGKRIARNTPTLLHAAFQQGAFLDLRVVSLEDQATLVIHNPNEMGGSLEDAALSVSRNRDYARKFRTAFSAEADEQGNRSVTPRRIRRVLADYIRSLSPFNSPWDRYMRGEEGALDEDARLGFNLFMGKAKCATCHFPPLFNGTVPPLFQETELEVLGLPAEPPPARPFLDPDSGRMGVDHIALSRGAFKTPTVRNAVFTAPYMHNGVFRTLEEVVEFYDAGGGAGMGLEVPNQTLPADSLKLTEGEERALVAFLKSLSDTAGTTAADTPPLRYSSTPDP